MQSHRPRYPHYACLVEPLEAAKTGARKEGIAVKAAPPGFWHGTLTEAGHTINASRAAIVHASTVRVSRRCAARRARGDDPVPPGRFAAACGSAVGPTDSHAV